MKVHVVQLNPIIGDCSGNGEAIRSALIKARFEGADLVVFPEMAISGYPPEDLLFHDQFLAAIEGELEAIIEVSQGIAAVFGLPRYHDREGEKNLVNSAAIISDGELLGFQDKMLLPTYDVFNERRYFTPGEEIHVWPIKGKKVVVTICEDLWQHSELLELSAYNFDPVGEIAPLKPDLLVNIAASPFHVGKHALRQQVCQKASKTLQCPVVLCNQVGANDELIFDGYSLVVDGKLIQEGKGFKEDRLIYDMESSYSAVISEVDPIADLYHGLVLGVSDYFRKQGFKKACLGISGGIDSAVVACIAAKALGEKNVLGVMMASRYTSEESVKDASLLGKNLGIEQKTISIESIFTDYLELLAPHFEGRKPDVTEENLQSRIRGVLLMALSNKWGKIVLSTGNKSEMAMGYATLYGDMCGGLGVLGDVTKSQVYALAKWINRDREVIPTSIITKPPSAELRPNQKDSDFLPPYDTIDTIIREYVEEGRDADEIVSKHNLPADLVEEVIEKIYKSEYKRRQSPPLLRVTEKAFSAGRRFPIVQRWY